MVRLTGSIVIAVVEPSWLFTPVKRAKSLPKGANFHDRACFLTG